MKSDEAVSPSLKKLLSLHTKVLELVPEHLKDWHPGSNGQVMDLLHPSLLPLVYGTTRVLPSDTVPLETCVQYTGMGELAKGPKGPGEHISIPYETNDGRMQDLPAWGSFQWLPTDVTIGAKRRHGYSENPKIVSYINNLHPETHPGLYDVLALLVGHAIPLWNETLSWFQNMKRIPHS